MPDWIQQVRIALVHIAFALIGGLVGYKLDRLVGTTAAAAGLGVLGLILALSSKLIADLKREFAEQRARAHKLPMPRRLQIERYLIGKTREAQFAWLWAAGIGAALSVTSAVALKADRDIPTWVVTVAAALAFSAIPPFGRLVNYSLRIADVGGQISELQEQHERLVAHRKTAPTAVEFAAAAAVQHPGRGW